MKMIFSTFNNYDIEPFGIHFLTRMVVDEHHRNFIIIQHLEVLIFYLQNKNENHTRCASTQNFTRMKKQPENQPFPLFDEPETSPLKNITTTR